MPAMGTSRRILFTKGIRIVKIRTGVVLDKKSGAYAKISKTVKHGIASAIGSGNQYIPWIHISDIVEIFAKAIEDNKMQGIFNGVAPEHVTNKEFTLKLAKSLNKSVIMPNIPAFTLRLLFGEMADILLNGSRVSSEKIIQSGFTFQYPSLEKAFKSLALI
jgi:uncharacterized protein (TIGR01777 family)